MYIYIYIYVFRRLARRLIYVFRAPCKAPEPYEKRYSGPCKARNPIKT